MEGNTQGHTLANSECMIVALRIGRVFVRCCNVLNEKTIRVVNFESIMLHNLNREGRTRTDTFSTQSEQFNSLTATHIQLRLYICFVDISVTTSLHSSV